MLRSYVHALVALLPPRARDSRRDMVGFLGGATAAGVHAALEWNEADMAR